MERKLRKKKPGTFGQKQRGPPVEKKKQRTVKTTTKSLIWCKKGEVIKIEKEKEMAWGTGVTSLQSIQCTFNKAKPTSNEQSSSGAIQGGKNGLSIFPFLFPFSRFLSFSANDEGVRGLLLPLLIFFSPARCVSSTSPTISSAQFWNQMAASLQ